jgi:hypothetical protein
MWKSKFNIGDRVKLVEVDMQLNVQAIINRFKVNK